MPVAGLVFDLSSWRAGVRMAGDTVKNNLNDRTMGPFNLGISRALAGARTQFKNFGTGVYNLLGGTFTRTLALLGGLGVGLGLSRIFTEALRAADDYDDSVKILDASLGTLGANVDLSKAEPEIAKFREMLTSTLAVTDDQVNNALADSITRKFSLREGAQLVALAANIAQKTGKPFEDVAKKVFDAGQGEVEGLKEFGLQIDKTGTASERAQRAITELKNKFGTIGADLVSLVLN